MYGTRRGSHCGSVIGPVGAAVAAAWNSIIDSSSAGIWRVPPVAWAQTTREPGRQSSRSLAPTAEACAPDPMTRIVTYNVHRCVGNDRRLNVARVAQVLADLAPDIDALQALDGGQPR